MTEHGVQAVLALFPTRRKDYRGADVWRACIEEVCVHLASRSASEREALFEEVRMLRAHEPRRFEVDEKLLWFFVHPTFQVFEEVWQDPAVCRSFADFYEALYRSVDRHGQVCRKNLKRRIYAPAREVDLLGVRYAQLLARHFPLFATPHVGSVTQGARIVRLLEYPTLTDTEARAAYEMLERRIVANEVAALAKQCEVHHAAQYARMFPICGSSIDASLLRADDVVSGLTVAEFTHANQVAWKPIGLSACPLMRFVRKGVWPSFRVEGVTSADITGARCIDATVNRTFLDAVVDVHRTRTTLELTRIRQVHNGLLPIGLKIHCLTQVPDSAAFLESGGFRAHDARACFNLPPVGSVAVVAELLERIEQLSGVSFLNNPHVQIQVCSAGELSQRLAGLLTIGFYLGSDSIRRYVTDDFVTSHPANTGGRIVIYGAHVLDREFEWWGLDERGGIAVGPLPEAVSNRTDVLSCTSMRDIRNVNLIATLLIHVQYGGYWAELGRQFVADMEDLLTKHQLMGLLDVEWVRQRRVGPGERSAVERDQGYIDAITELTTYAFEEVERVARATAQGDACAATSGILFEVNALLEWYHTEIVAHTVLEGGRSSC